MKLGCLLHGDKEAVLVFTVKCLVPWTNVWHPEDAQKMFVK